MRQAFVVAAAALIAACAPAGKSVVKQRATAQVNPTEREKVYARALDTVQRRGWIIAVSDRAGGLLTTQTMATGVKPCGSITCDSRSTLQVTITETGSVTVNLHRELFVAYTNQWFVPTLDRDVAVIEGEQRGILAEIVGEAAAKVVAAPAAR
jgi:hypothetical protein